MNYKEGAMHFYDFFGEKDDEKFYVEQAKKHGTTALEMGIGTARLAILLAREGIETWGLEKSPYMLKAAHKKIKKEEPDVQALLHLVSGNAIDFNLQQKFDFIYFPSCSFDHILEPRDQYKALRNIKRHLNPNGGYVFDLYVKKKNKLDKGWFIQKKELSKIMTIVRSGYYFTDFEKRIMSLDMWYEVVENGRVMERYFEASQVYIHRPEEVRKMLFKTGFKVVEEYGNYHGKHFENDEIIIFVTRVKNE
jgi:ubiquinone/menaquinone biosynthesis C-methylase UbiE